MDSTEAEQTIHEWYENYGNDIYKFIFFLIGDHEQAKDMVQETFLRAYRKLESFDGENPKSWLFRIARNRTIDYIRKKKPIAFAIDSVSTLKTTEKTPEQMALLNDTERQLYVSLSRMKRSYREVIVLRKIKEFSIKESAHILGWSEAKVKMTLYRGMDVLKKELVKEGYDHGTVWREE